MEERTSTSIVSVFPDPLVITQSKNSNIFESKLNLTNLTNDYVVFKIYNNQHSLYSAKPSTSYIPPKETTNVAIKRFKKEENQSQVGKDKFLLMFFTINKVINDNDEAKEAIKQKLYNENSKQETVISIILKNQEEELESTFTYNESVLEDIGDDYSKGIKAYNDLNENLRKQTNSINNKIKELENVLEMIKTQNELKIGKDNALKDNRKINKSNEISLSKIILVGLVLLGLLIGANLSILYNKAFSHKPVKEEAFVYQKENLNENRSIITNVNENNNYSTVNESIKNETKKNEEKNINENKNDNKEQIINSKSDSPFLNKSIYFYLFLIILYLNYLK